MDETARQIVVVDDEPEVLNLVRDVLEMGGFHVTGVTTPDRIADAIHGMQPDLFVLDIMLPGLSGIELAERLHAMFPSPPPMIALSASRLMLSLAQESPYFAASLSKPFDITTLLDTVQRVMLPVGPGAGTGSSPA